MLHVNVQSLRVSRRRSVSHSLSFLASKSSLSLSISQPLNLSQINPHTQPDSLIHNRCQFAAQLAFHLTRCAQSFVELAGPQQKAELVAATCCPHGEQTRSPALSRSAGRRPRAQGSRRGHRAPIDDEEGTLVATTFQPLFMRFINSHTWALRSATSA